MENLNLIGEIVMRIHFSESEQTIKKIEYLKIISTQKTTVKLNNGVTLSKGSLFPYHRKNYRHNEEYFLLEN